jgi:hypothetical protein
MIVMTVLGQFLTAAFCRTDSLELVTARSITDQFQTVSVNVTYCF